MEQPFERDASEPVAHINQFVDELITADGEPFEDGMLIIGNVLNSMLIARGGMGASEQRDVHTLRGVFMLIQR